MSELDFLPCGILRTADDGTIQLANRTFAQWIGYAADELVGRRFQDLLTVGGRIFHHTHWAPLLRMQGSLSEVKLEVRHRDGSTLPMVLNAFRTERGGSFVHDIATYVARDRDRYEQELVRSRRNLEELHAAAKDRALFAEQMIGIVSHDLRNPLSAITMGTALLENTGLTPQQQRTVDRIARSTQRANTLIADLLDFTQARVGQGISVALAPIALHDVIHDAIDELRLAFSNRTLEHVREGDGGCIGDAARLTQLVGNLVSNAATYGAPEMPITVTTATTGSRASIAVHNHGTPIPPALQAHIFEPMKRGTSTGAQARSVGLGLFIVREIARAHGGTATVISTAEAGTTFRIAWDASSRATP